MLSFPAGSGRTRGPLLGELVLPFWMSGLPAGITAAEWGRDGDPLQPLALGGWPTLESALRAVQDTPDSFGTWRWKATLTLEDTSQVDVIEQAEVGLVLPTRSRTARRGELIRPFAGLQVPDPALTASVTIRMEGVRTSVLPRPGRNPRAHPNRSTARRLPAAREFAAPARTLAYGKHSGDPADAGPDLVAGASLEDRGIEIGDTVCNRSDGSAGTVTAISGATVTAALGGGASNAWAPLDVYEIARGGSPIELARRWQLRRRRPGPMICTLTATDLNSGTSSASCQVSVY